MKKHIVSVLLILSGFSRYAESCTFNISEYNDTNVLMWQTPQFRNHVRHFFGSLTGYYFWRGSVAEQVSAGLWGLQVISSARHEWCRPVALIRVRKKQHISHMVTMNCLL